MLARPPAAVACIAIASCVTTVEAPPPAAALDAGPIVVPLQPLNKGGAGAVDAYYASILGQLRDAERERDVERMLALVAAHDDPRAPGWAKPLLASFRDSATGLSVAEHAARRARLYAPAAQLVIGGPIDFSLDLGAAPDVGGEVQFDGAEGGLAALVTIEVRDTDALGAVSTRRASQVLRPAEPQVTWRDGIVLPFHVDLEAGAAVVRELDLRAELLPGNAVVAGRVCPLPRTAIASERQEIYPRGVEPIRSQPLRTLRAALARGDRAHFAHAYLAARFMPEEDRGAAMAALIDRVRLGEADQARAAMACLRLLAGEAEGGVDREGWLRWWEARGGR